MNRMYILLLTLFCITTFAASHKESSENHKLKKEIGLVTIKVGKFFWWKDAKLYAVTPKPFCLLTFHSREDSLKTEKNLPKGYAKKMDLVMIRAMRHFNLMNGLEYPVGSKFFWKIFDDFSIDFDREVMPQLKSKL